MLFSLRDPRIGNSKLTDFNIFFQEVKYLFAYPPRGPEHMGPRGMGMENDELNSIYRSPNIARVIK